MDYKKKAQAQNAMFYIVGLVIVILILIMGTYYYGKFKMSNNDVTFKLFESKMNKDVSTLKLESSGSTTQASYNFPDGISEICFVDVELAKQNREVFTIIGKQDIIKAIDAESQNNIFMYGKRQYSIYIEGLRVSAPVSCIKEIENKKMSLRYLNDKNQVFVLTPADEDYCRNADSSTPKLCDDLDVFLYDGYKQECCNKFGVCC